MLLCRSTQANVPPDWRELPGPTGFELWVRLVLRPTRAAGVGADANQPQLPRTMWLDFSGAPAHRRRQDQRTQRQGWRLEMSPPYALQSARTAAENSLLVTAGMAPGFSGVEVRDQDLDLTTVARLPRSDGALLATGWHQRLSEVRGTLIVGPGYRLLAAPGTDAAPQWLERCSCWAFFAVLDRTVAWRVLGLRLAAPGVGALALTYQESGADLALAQRAHRARAVARPGGLSRWAGAYRLIASRCCCWCSCPSRSQARLAVYPQLEASVGSGYPASGVRLDRRGQNAPAAAERSRRGSTRQVRGAQQHGNPQRQERSEIEVTAARRVSSDYYEPGVVGWAARAAGLAISRRTSWSAGGRTRPRFLTVRRG